MGSVPLRRSSGCSEPTLTLQSSPRAAPQSPPSFAVPRLRRHVVDKWNQPQPARWETAQEGVTNPQRDRHPRGATSSAPLQNVLQNGRPEVRRDV